MTDFCRAILYPGANHCNPKADNMTLAWTRPFRFAPLALAALITMAPLATFAQAPAEMPPTGVSIVTLEARSIPVMNELPGRIAPTRIAEVRSRVTGIIQERVFEQGSLVKQGDVLYRVDPKLFRVRVASAKASLQRAQATERNAAQQHQRQQVLHARKASSDVELENAAVVLAQAQADVALAEAALEEAEINLGYTEVKAPISGIIGGALITEGALVNADSGEPLATIQQIDPVYVDFTQSSSQMMELRRAVETGKLERVAPGEARIQLVFDDGSLYEHPGSLLFSSATVDVTTGQVTLRGEFPNPDRHLLPGLYVRVRIEQAVRQNALTISQRAVMRDLTGAAQVYVVGPDNKAELRNVTLGFAMDSGWVVESGLSAGDKVVVEGAQKLQPGATVAPEEWKPAAPADQAETGQNETQPAK